MSRRSLDGKRVIITGASGGIGREIARELATRQCRLVLNARREERLLEVAQEVTQRGGEAVTVIGDISDSATQQQLITSAQTEFQGLDALINNAGIGAIGRFADASADRLSRIMRVNFFAPAELTRQAIPLLKQGDAPVITNISSVLAHRAAPMKSEYCASKFALHGWSDSLRAELTDDGIDVVLVSPSTTDSEFFDNVIENSTGKYWKLSNAKSPSYVARRTIRAMERGNHEVILSWSGWSLVWLDRLFPALADRLVARFGK